MRKLLTLLSIISVFGLKVIYASHIIGGEIITTCLGDSTYEIKLILYRDCTSLTGFDASACIGVFEEDGSFVETFNLFDLDIIEIEITSPDPCIEIPPGLCVEQGIYIGEYTLPSTFTTYDFVFQRCCRNAGIVNIETPDDVGASYWGRVPKLADYPCNNSPYFINYPPLALCVGSPINFDHSANDADGDSLAYKFIHPFQGGDPFTAVIPCPPDSPEDLPLVDWVTGYDETYPIDASPILAIDPFTGLLSGTPTAEGRYVVCIAVDEFRDGVLLSTHYRDFQFNIQTCIPTTIASTAEYILDCEDYSVEFENFSEGADFYLWDFGDGTTSDLFEPIHVYGDTGTYIVTLIANPGFDCADTFTAVILIYNTLTADFNYNAGCSGEPVSFSDESVSTEAGEIISWDWDFGDGGTSTESDPEHDYDVGGIYTVTLTVETDKGCISTTTINVNLLSGPDAEFEVDDVCQNIEAEFSNETTMPDGVIIADWDWDFGDGNSSSEESPIYQYSEPGTYTVTLIATSTNGCKDTIQYEIEIGELPEANAGPDDTVNYLENYVLNGSGNGTFVWEPAVLMSNPFIEDPEIRPTTTLSYIVTVTSPDGCVGKDTVIIVVIDRTIVEMPNAFSPNGDNINDVLYILNHSVNNLLEYSIYNRWGQLIFTTNDVNVGWDGTIDGKEVEMGTYVYLIRAIELSGAELQIKGNVTLIR